MNRTLPILALSAALALGACSKEPNAPASQSPSEAATQAVVEQTAEPSAVATEADEAAVVTNEIPEAIRGRWGMVPADCTSTRGDAKGLMVVSADTLKFYESVAKLGEIKEAGESRVRATFSYTGEGQSWTQDVVLDVAPNGKTLTRREYGKDAMPGPQKYTRCT